MISIKKLTCALTLMLAFAACSNESDPVANKANFTRIYDNNNFNTAYTPLDLRQTPDGGFLILGSRRLVNSNFTGIYILKVNEFGEFVNEIELESDHVSPAPQLFELGGSYYFFCMTPVGLRTELIKLDVDGNIEKVNPVNASYPLAAAIDNTSFILLSYDNVNKLSVVSVVNPSGSIGLSKGYTIGAGDQVEEPIINHFIRTGRQYPFQVGKALSGQYFFNGFYNYTFSFVFTNLTQDNPPVIQGQQDDGGISQVAQIDNSKFAVARFNFGDNYFIPNSTLNNSGVSSSVDLGGTLLPELVSNAPVRIIKHQLGDKPVLIYGSNTRNNQIGLYIYHQSTGEFLGSTFLGFGNSFDVTSVIVTSDGGIALSGLTYIAGRLPRICLFKLSASALSQSIQ
jgi:hypothetical protein